MNYSTWINQMLSIILITSTFVVCTLSDVLRPRGVSLSKASLYSPTKDFTCFDGTVTIPFAYVNDDYCDCFDGSDEPGTSACLNGVFHCTNAGHRPLNLPSSRVNDGVCDCCDGSDEYAMSDSCPNICVELGKEARAEARRLAEIHKAGSHLRLELIEKGNKKHSEMVEQLAQLEKDKDEALQIQNEKEALKNDIEAKENDALQVYRDEEEQDRKRKAEEERQNLVKEATDYFIKLDSNNDGHITADEIKVVNVFDKNKDGQVDGEEIIYFLGENEMMDKENFISITWPLLKPLLMMEQGMFKPADDEEETADLENDAEDLPEQEPEADADHEDEHLSDDLPDTDEPEPVQSHGYDEETQKLVDEATDARRQYTDAERTVREIESKIRSLQENIEKDYGLQQEFAFLDSQCLEYEDKEYVYKLCLFQKVTQKSKNGGAEVGLGNWGEWAGVDHEKYTIMKYTNGVACWNGPNRLTVVNVQCGLENKLLSVTEPHRCEYKIELSTPAACDESNYAQHASHDEL